VTISQENYDAMLRNLTATQERCNEILGEKRRWEAAFIASEAAQERMRDLQWRSLNDALGHADPVDWDDAIAEIKALVAESPTVSETNVQPQGSSPRKYKPIRCKKCGDTMRFMSMTYVTKPWEAPVRTYQCTSCTAMRDIDSRKIRTRVRNPTRKG